MQSESNRIIKNQNRMGGVRYTFRYLRGKWVIFDNDIPTDEWFTYAMKEAARKRVYELNGWTYKEKEK